MKPRYLKILKRAQSGRSLTAAVHIHCLRCCGLKREEVRNCPKNDCELYTYRPYKAKKSVLGGVKTPLRISQRPDIQDFACATEAIAPPAVTKHPAKEEPLRINPVRSERISPPKPPNPEVLHRRRIKQAAFNLLNFCREFIKLLKPGGILARGSDGATLVKKAEKFIAEIDK